LGNFRIGVDSTNYFTGYIQDLRITKGYARYQPAVPTANLAVSSNSVLLVPGNTANTVLRDSSVNNFQLTPFGDSRASNFTPYGTGWSAYFDGTGDYLSIAQTTQTDLGANNFTLEMWVYFTGLNNSIGVNVTGKWNSTNQWILQYRGPGLDSIANQHWRFYFNSSTGFDFTESSTTSVTTNTWYHIAMVRNGSNWNFYRDGVQIGSTGSSSATVTATSDTLTIGTAQNVANIIQGYISNYRLVVGTAVYTANFVPPTAPLTAVTNTVLLACHTNRFADGSTNNLAITRNGDTAVRAFNPFNITNTGTAGSMYFDGTGDYLSAAYNSAFDLGSSDFTLEAWIYTSDSSSNYPSIVGRWQGSGTACWDLRPRSTDRGNFLVFVYTTNGTTAAFVDSNGPALSDNAWHHVVAVRSGNNFALFVDGTRRNTANFSGVTIFNSASAPLYVGYDPWGTTSFTGYLSNVRVVKGTAVYDPTQTTLTIPTAPLTATANTQLLTLQYRQPHNNHGFQDSSSNQFLITRLGNASQSTFSPFSPTGWSVYCGSSDQFSSTTSSPSVVWGSFNNTATLSMEFWVFSPSFPGYQIIADQSGGLNYLMFSINSSGQPHWYWYNSGGYACTSTQTITANRWTHVATAIDNGAISIYIDGIKSTVTGTTTASGPGGGTGRLAIGAGPFWISNLRVIRNQAIFRGTSFSVSTTPLTTSTIGHTGPGVDVALRGYVSLLIANTASGFQDQSFNRTLFTLTSSPQTVAFSPFSTGSYNPVVHGGSYYSDASGDGLRIFDPTPLFGVGGDFTVELWFYPTAGPSNYNVLWYFADSSATDNPSFALFYNTAYNIFWLNNGAGGTGTLDTTNNITLTTNSWNHIAVSRVGADIRLWLNGQLRATNWTATAINTNKRILTIGVSRTASDSVGGYISNFRFVNGTGIYSGAGSISVPTAPFTSAPNTIVLCNFTDAAIQDLDTINTLETVGDAREVNFGPLMSNYSVYFDGSGDYLTTPSNAAFAFGTGDFTVEAWVYVTGTNYCEVYTTASGSFPTTAMRLMITNAQKLQFYDGTNSATSTGSVLLNSWTHVALSRSGTSVRLFINGTQDGTTTSSNNLTQQIGYIGRTWDSFDFTGYISNLRIIKGIALYTVNFTPPTAPLTAVPGTSLLTCHANRFRDSSANNFAITRNGDAKVTDFSPFGAQTANPPSISFDGTGDFLTMADTPVLELGSSNFTIEAWVFPLVITGSNRPIFGHGNDNQNWMAFYITSSATIEFAVVSGNSTLLDRITTATVNPGAWTHLAVTRNGSTFTIYINGVEQTSYTGSPTTTASAIPDYTGASWIGGNRWPSEGSMFNGYISDLRITRGQVLYGGFEPPTQPFATR
jgi:hypothetical protein